jgi:signal peptidase I
MSKFGTVKVAGGSMLPAYQDGDWLFVSWFPAGLKPLNGDHILGKVVVIEREERPGIYFVKRLQKSHGGIYWVQGDNDESTDSRTWGWIPANEIVGVVLFRYKRGKGFRTPNL